MPSSNNWKRRSGWQLPGEYSLKVFDLLIFDFQHHWCTEDFFDQPGQNLFNFKICRDVEGGTERRGGNV